MAISFAHDANRNVATGMTPAVAALATTYDATVSASTEVTLNANTSYIEVTAIDKAIFLKWGTADVTNANFDAVIPANTTRAFFVPPGIGAVNFIEQAATAILAVTER